MLSVYLISCLFPKHLIFLSKVIIPSDSFSFFSFTAFKLFSFFDPCPLVETFRLVCVYVCVSQEGYLSLFIWILQVKLMAENLSYSLTQL